VGVGAKLAVDGGGVGSARAAPGAGGGAMADRSRFQSPPVDLGSRANPLKSDARRPSSAVNPVAAILGDARTSGEPLRRRRGREVDGGGARVWLVRGAGSQSLSLSSLLSYMMPSGQPSFCNLVPQSYGTV